MILKIKYNFYTEKYILKMPSAKLYPFCLRLDVLRTIIAKKRYVANLTNRQQNVNIPRNTHMGCSSDYFKFPHDDVIRWKHFPVSQALCEWNPPVNDGPPRGALMFSLICAWTHDWTNNRDVDDLRRHHVHYDVAFMEREFGHQCAFGCLSQMPLLLT